jgi:hypothetical protein
MPQRLILYSINSITVDTLSLNAAWSMYTLSKWSLVYLCREPWQVLKRLMMRGASEKKIGVI